MIVTSWWLVYNSETSTQMIYTLFHKAGFAEEPRKQITLKKLNWKKLDEIIC